MKVARYLVALAAIVVIWQVGALLLGVRVLPSPTAVACDFVKALGQSIFWEHTAASSLRASSGLLLGFSVAWPLGLLLGLSPALDRWLAPFIFITYPVPKILFLPVFLVLLGLGEAPKVILVALTVGYQILMVVRDSVRGIDSHYFESFATLLPLEKRSSLAGFLSLARHVAVPAALPAAITALRIATGTGVAVLFMAESFATDRGLGIMIIDSWGGLDLPRMFTGIVAMGLLGLILHWICECLEAHFSRWSSAME